jgi:DNA-binding SARP family transcriptional activator
MRRYCHAVADRLQLCGPLVVRVDDRRVEGELPGRQGRALLAFLALHRRRSVTRDELAVALWPEEAPPGADNTLSTLVSRTRRAVGAERLVGRSELRLAWAPDAHVDVEVADRAVHEAESAVAQARWADAWAPARTALHVAVRGFLPGYVAPWIPAQREHVDNVRLRALETICVSGLALGGSELPSAERAARSLIVAAPYRESGYAHLMRWCVARGDVAEALAVYEALRIVLRDELGTAPGAALQALHAELL